VQQMFHLSGEIATLQLLLHASLHQSNKFASRMHPSMHAAWGSSFILSSLFLSELSGDQMCGNASSVGTKDIRNCSSDFDCFCLWCLLLSSDCNCSEKLQTLKVSSKLTILSWLPCFCTFCWCVTCCQQQKR